MKIKIHKVDQNLGDRLESHSMRRLTLESRPFYFLVHHSRVNSEELSYGANPPNLEG
jgi:hypothetical protein